MAHLITFASRDQGTGRSPRDAARLDAPASKRLAYDEGGLGQVDHLLGAGPRGRSPLPVAGVIALAKSRREPPLALDSRGSAAARWADWLPASHGGK